MEVAIETLFTDNLNRDDLVLLYFSGHGVRDDNGMLYFAVSNTQKSPQGRIRTATAVSSGAVQGYMSQSRSKRQVLILDCCFSGAFASDMKAKDDKTVDVKAQLGGEGRAVLTSSTATQVSYEKEGASLYTTYLVQGLETGAADRDGNGQITVDELHVYAREKVQEQAPTMQPEIYAAREGYKIFIARAPQGDPKLTFRKEVDERAKQKHGNLSPIDLRALKFRGRELELKTDATRLIIDEVLHPYRAFWAKISEFEEALQEIPKLEPEMRGSSLDDLKYFQRVLKLRDENVKPVFKKHGIPFTSESSQPDRITQKELPESPLVEKDVCLQKIDGQSISPSPSEIQNKLIIEVSQESERGLDYNRLRDLLQARKWWEADQETAKLMLKAAGKEAEKRCYLRLDEVRNFPCSDLRTIDKLWVRYSEGNFGFSVQKQIWVEVGGKLDFGEDSNAAREAFRKMSERNGWRVKRLYRILCKRSKIPILQETASCPGKSKH